MTTLFEQIGGEERIRPLIRDFVRRMVDDTMIGFFFRGVDHERLIKHEYQFTARFLGAKIPYEGQPIGAAHRPHRIMGGQFDRRRRILEETMHHHGIEPDLCSAWLAHVDELRSIVTGDTRGQCNTADDTSTEPAPSPFRILG